MYLYSDHLQISLDVSSIHLSYMSYYHDCGTIKFPHIASILTHLESKCFIHLEPHIFTFSVIFSHIASIFTFIVDIFSHLATFSHIAAIFTFEGATVGERKYCL